MLNLSIVRGPLKSAQNEVILREYNRLTGSQIPMDEYLNWVEKSPAGPAWHALLETETGAIAGHTSLFPFTTRYEKTALTPAKSEYSFMLEDFRKEKISGHEKAARATFVVMLDELFRKAQEVGWGPIFASTNEKNQAFTRRIGLQPIEYSVCECLYVLRPFNASRHTPNLNSQQRMALVAAGASQRALWAARHSWSRQNGVAPVDVNEVVAEPEVGRLAFFEDPESTRWRYLSGQYVRLAASTAAPGYVIAKRGSASRYLRVCQWKTGARGPIQSLAIALLRQARADGAIGVRWAVYEEDAEGLAIIEQLRGLGFVCARRERIVMVHKKDPDFLTQSAWRMNDSLFSFDP